MAGRERKTKRERRSSIRGAMLLIVFVAFVMLVVMVVSGSRLSGRISDNEARIEELQELIDEEELRTAEIEELEEYMQSDEYLEQEAKEKLGFVKEGEIIFRESN